ncbi:MAG TPA: LLM class flavin-dependent oxidoreductase [Solirubrobacterales bacterium]
MSAADATPRRGIVVFGATLDTMVDAAVAADAAGFDAIWTSELYNRSAIVTLAAIAPRTSHARIGSGIVYGVGRSPLMLAAEARDLDELSGGRMILGIGNGTRRMISDWHGLDGASPAGRIEELVPLVRELWDLDEKPVNHDGRFYRCKIAGLGGQSWSGEEPIPIYVAGANRRMMESAGRVADGLLAHTMCSPAYLEEVARPAVAAGAEHAGRDAAAVEIGTYALACAAEDADVARREAAAMIAFYATVKSYAPMFDTRGFAAEAAAIRAAFSDRDLKTMIGAVTEPMVDEFACAGTPAEVAAALGRYDGVVDEVVLSVPSFQVSDERVAENLSLLTDRCAP